MIALRTFGASIRMSQVEQQHAAHTTPQDRARRPKDDEQLSKEHIEQTGEPKRDALGNQDGAS
jgi:hypothetical protein